MIFVYLLLCWLGLGEVPSWDKGNSDKVLALVSQLGNEEFTKREAASNALHKLMKEGKVPIMFVENIAKGKNKCFLDMEVRQRCRFLMRDAFAVESDVQIWYLPDNLRFPLGREVKVPKPPPARIGMGVIQGQIGRGFPFPRIGVGRPTKPPTVHTVFDLGAYYYAKARESGGWKGEISWHYEPIEKEATRMLVKDLLRGGMSKAAVKEFLKRMEKNRAELTFDPLWEYSNRAGSTPPPPLKKRDPYDCGDCGW